MSLEDFKADVTYEKKTTYGIIGIVIGILSWGIGHPYVGFMDIVLLILPCIFLAIPSQITKNSKGLAIISMIILVIAFFVLIGGYFYNLSRIIQLILCIYGLFCAYVMTIPTGPKQIPVNSSNINAGNNQKFDKYCTECGQGLLNNSKFCSKCGVEVTEDVHEDSSQEDMEENNEKVCSECGHELNDDSKFCSECGVEVTDVIQEDSSQEDMEEDNEKVCSECGHELNDDSKFCPECGVEVTDVIQEDSSLDYVEENSDNVQEDSSLDDVEENSDNVQEDSSLDYVEENSDNVQEDSSLDYVEENSDNVCSECGHELNNDSIFCPECGARVSTSNEETLE